MIRVTGNNSLLMSLLNTDTDNDTKVVDLLKKSSETEKSSKTTGKKSEEYDSVKKSASSLKASAAVLSETGEDSIFAKAEESGDYSDLISLIERFTGDYNSLLESLSDLDTDKSANYSKELKSIISGQSEALQKVGITVDSNGKLVIDEGTLKNADKKELKDLFQGENSVAGKVADKSIYIGANAAADQYVDSCQLYSRWNIRRICPDGKSDRQLLRLSFLRLKCH